MLTAIYEADHRARKLQQTEHNRPLAKTPGKHWELMNDALKAYYSGKTEQHQALMRELAAMTGSMWYFEKVGWE